MATLHQFIDIPINKDFDEDDRERIAGEVIKHIIKRAKSGLKPTRGKFPKYTKAYAAFKGVSRSDVDLTLDDNMLNAMRLLKSSPGNLKIVYKEGSKENGKADGNIRGTYGKPKPIPGKARPFLGINKTALQAIIKKYK